MSAICFTRQDVLSKSIWTRLSGEGSNRVGLGRRSHSRALPPEVLGIARTVFMGAPTGAASLSPGHVSQSTADKSNHVMTVNGSNKTEIIIFSLQIKFLHSAQEA